MTQSANRDDDFARRRPLRNVGRRLRPWLTVGKRTARIRGASGHVPACRAAVAELSGIPALLAQLDCRGSGCARRPDRRKPRRCGPRCSTRCCKGRVAASAHAQAERDRRWPPRRPCVAVALVVGILARHRRRGSGGDAQPMASAVTMSKVARDADQRHRHPDRVSAGAPGSTWSAPTATMRAAVRRTTQNLAMVVVGQTDPRRDRDLGRAERRDRAAERQHDDAEGPDQGRASWSTPIRERFCCKQTL